MAGTRGGKNKYGLLSEPNNANTPDSGALLAITKPFILYTGQ